jgi:hypothetical protein
MITLQNITDKMYDLLRESESDSWAYPLSFMQDLANQAQLRICSGKLFNPLQKQAVRKSRLPFLNTDQFYSNLAWTSLTVAAVIWATTLDAVTTNYPASGSLFVDWNLLTYTWVTGTQFTGIPATWEGSIAFAHAIGTRVFAAFDLPSDFMSGIQVIYNNKYKLENKLYDDIWEDLNSLKWTNNFRLRNNALYNWFIEFNPFYVFIDDLYLVPFNLNNTGDKIHLRYEKIPTVMSAITDTSIITNDQYAIMTVPYIAVWELLYNRWEEQRAAEILNFWLWQVSELYDFYNNKSAEKPSKTQYWAWQARFLNI